MTESGAIEKNRKKLLQSENCCTIIGDTWSAAPTLHETRQVPGTCVTRKSLELLPKYRASAHTRAWGDFPHVGRLMSLRVCLTPNMEKSS